jgi:hypothetical protein
VIHPVSKSRGYVGQSQLAEQLEVLNRAFAGDECDNEGRACDKAPMDARVRFVNHKTVYWPNDAWSTSGAVSSIRDTVAATVTRNYNSANYFNIIIADLATSLGWTQYPWSNKEGSTRQGSSLDHEELSTGE